MASTWQYRQYKCVDVMLWRNPSPFLFHLWQTKLNQPFLSLKECVFRDATVLLSSSSVRATPQSRCKKFQALCSVSKLNAQFRPCSWSRRLLSLSTYTLITNLHMELYSIWTGTGSLPGSLRTVKVTSSCTSVYLQKQAQVGNYKSA